ncbi:uncharacterized protein LOC132623004 [Lycium barbarum]|uniref:uncharacterized protein LOC132623004 n=1 Tax=Lycium barbarum TaxID=112863 RepID=UPI00293EC8B4|nr:uncharacterized protein LOC132623004 [Lycium barbarum]
MSTPTKEASTVEDEVSADEKEDWILKATEMVDWLYDFCYQHYPTNPEERISDIEHQISSCIKVLDLIPQEKRQSEHERSTFAYLKGRLYNAVPDVYKEEAERHLEVATNLNPLFLDAWNHLGMCVAKKGDYRRAKNCFEFVLKMDPTSMVLRQLAELELLFSPAAEDPIQQLGECIKYAQQTLALDNMDGRCLYILGSAYLTSFYLTGGWNYDNLLLSLEAFEKAEKIDAMKSHPNLRYDCAIVNRFLENYKRTLIGLSDAASPSLDHLHQVNVTLQLLDRIEGLLQGKSNDKSKGKCKGKSKGKSKGKGTETSVSSLIQSLATIDLNLSYNRATINLLTEGLNKGIAVIAAVRCLVKYEYKAPVYYLLCDADENSFVLIVFGIQKEAIKQGDQVTLLEPFCKFVDFDWEGKHYQFKSVRVNLPGQVLVNGNVVSPNFVIRESILFA